MIDGIGRKIEYLRISITDRCNLRCVYCMPGHGVPELRHDDILRYEEIVRVARVMAGLGVRHLRLTGGEPTVRRNWADLVRGLSSLRGVENVGMTSNGLLLCDHIDEAKNAGLTELNLSLDTLNPDTYARLTRSAGIDRVLTTLDQAIAAGLNVKINVVPIRGLNDGELVRLSMLAKDRPICVRFIELMPVGCAKGFLPIPCDEILRVLSEAYDGLPADAEAHGHGPAWYVKPAGFVGSVGFISPLSHEFCDSCNRVRLTADGRLKLCLNHTSGLDLRALLRGDARDEEIEEAIRRAVASKPARHAFYEGIDDREARNMNEIGG